MKVPEAIRLWLETHSGLDLEALGDALLKKAFMDRIREAAGGDEADYIRLWRREDLEKERLLKELLVGETWFFREWPAFEVMADFIQATRGRWSSNHPLRILSLPASTGEEPWSIGAMCQKLGLTWEEVQIDALDINPAALDVAKRGLYPRARFRGRSPGDWPEAFEPLEQGGETLWRVREALRAMVAFEVRNALGSDFLEGQRSYHLIFLRNLLIYLNPSARIQLLERLGRCLLPEGLVFLGHAEVFPLASGFRRIGRIGAFAWRQVPLKSPEEMPKAKSRRPSAANKPHTLEGACQAQKRPADITRVLPPEARDRGQSEGDLKEARRLADEGSYREALDLLDRSHLIQATRPEVHCLAGILYSALGMSQEAIRRFRRALYLDPHHAESLFHLALVLEGRGESQAALRLRARMPASVDTLP